MRVTKAAFFRAARTTLLFLPLIAKASDQQLQTASGSSTNHDYWAVEDPNERAKLPLYQTIPAARPEELTPANGYPRPETFLTWHRSHGDNGGRRYSALDQINRQNVAKLQQAWIYHSGDGSNQIQCNPIVVGGSLIAPTAGHFVAAIDAENGKELWRFKPAGRPAFRGLIYAEDRVLFCAGKYLYALNATNGGVITTFGENGYALLPGRVQGVFGAASAGPAVFKEIIVVPGFEKDVWGFDLRTGKHLWTFHTVPSTSQLTMLTTNNVPAGSGPVTMLAVGSNFAPGATVQWTTATSQPGIAPRALSSFRSERRSR